MPPEPLPFDRKDFFKERKPSSSEPVGIVPARWREPPTTPSSYRGSSSSCRWGGSGGSSDFRRSFSGHGKAVSGGSHITTVDSGQREYKNCRNDNIKENNTNSSSRMLVALGSQKDLKVETTASPNSNSHPLSDSVNSWEQLQLNDQHAKNNGGEVSTTGNQNQRLEKENSLGSSLDWKPLKWIRSGSLSSRGSGFSHSSSCKIIGVDPLDTKIEAQLGDKTPLQSPSVDASPCLTPRTFADDVCSRKKPRLGWGEGLAKYEKKKVGPDDIVDKESGARDGMVDGVSSSEPLLSSPSNLPDKSPSLTGCSECASPNTPYSFACSSSPGLEEKDSIKATTVDNDTCNPSCQNHKETLAFNLENLEITEGFNLTSSLDELLQQSDDSKGPTCGFVRSTAMDKLQVWKADISRTLEITETEIDSLEIELKSLISSCHLPAASSSLPAVDPNNKNTEKRFDLKIIPSGDTLMEKADEELNDMERESPGTATSKLAEPLSDSAIERKDSPFNLDIRYEKPKFSHDDASDDMVDVVTGSSSTVSVVGDIQFSRQDDKLYNMIFASNKALANSASDAFSKMLPTTRLCTNISKTTDESLVKKRFAMRKRFMKFKERVMALKFWALQYAWKEDLRLLSIRRFNVKSQKKFEFNSRLGYADHQKHDSVYSRLSFGGSMSLVPTTEIVDYLNSVLPDSRVRVYRNALKMPCLILDKRERNASRFISDNGLVENPIDVEKERSMINPWTTHEKEIFLDKYSLFGKNFKKIASFLEHKTIADCVEFYYKNHKSDGFQKTKKNLEGGKSYAANTYLITSGKRLNRETSSSSLDMLGAASVMVANMDGGKQKYKPNLYVGKNSDRKQSHGDNGLIERSSNFAMFCNEQESAASVLAGICGSISPEALGSCITSPMGQKLRRQVLDDVDEETCSDDSCDDDMEACDWTDEEKASFLQGVRSYGKDFEMISRNVGTRSREECRVYYSKARKCLGLDLIHVEPGSEGTTAANQGGGGSDHEDAFMVDSGSVISHDKSSSECNKTELHSSDSREEQAESEQKDVVNVCREPELVLEREKEAEQETAEERISNGNLELEGAADSETANPEQDTCSKPSIEIQESPMNGLNSDLNDSDPRHFSRATSLDLSIARDCSEKVEEPKNGFLMPNLFPSVVTIPDRRTLSQDDVSSRRLSFRKSGDQRCSSTDGYHFHLSKHSLLDCEESSQILRGYPVTELQSNNCFSMKQNSWSDVEKEKPSSRNGDVKLFGQILTNLSGSNSNGPQKPNGGSKSFNLKFDSHTSSNDHRRIASLDLDRNNGYSLKNQNVPLKSYGFWDGNRIQTGFPSLPDSAILLAKYPAAFSNTASTPSSSKKLHSGFETRKLSYQNEISVQQQQQGRMNVNVVSDPVAAIRMHYAKTEEYKNVGEAWRSNVL